MTAKQQVDDMVSILPMMPADQSVPISSDIATGLYNEFLYSWPEIEVYFRYNIDTRTGQLQRGTIFIYRGINFRVV